MESLNSTLIKNRWQRTLESVRRMGGMVDLLEIGSPASEIEIAIVEKNMGMKVPQSLRDTLLGLSQHVRFRWFLPDGMPLPHEFRDTFCGDCHWSLDLLEQFNRDKNGWIEEVFPNPNDPHDSVWHNKFVFHEVSNGDFIGIELEGPKSGEVVYLSHDDGEGHGMRLGANIESFLLDWSRLGCVGGEDWQWLPFIEKQTGRLDPNGNPAQKFRRLLNLKI